MTESNRVYIVTSYNYDTGNQVFEKVFFSEEAAENWIKTTRKPERYDIETYEETFNGESKEIY
jgi:hypothetical protein